MFNVCPACGVYSAEKEVDTARSVAVCPACGHAHPFRRLPLFAVVGASGSGKTVLALGMAPRLTECVPFETDALWNPAFDRPDENYRTFRDICLRVAKNVNQAGRPAALFGTATPADYELSVERRYFAESHYLALVCDDDALERRLKGRPSWRGAADPAFIRRMLEYNRWLRDNAGRTVPPMTLLDTSGESFAETVERCVAWFRRYLVVSDGCERVPTKP